MKKLFFVILTILTVVVSANAQLRTLVETNIKWSTAGANVTITGPVDISDCWKPLIVNGLQSDSAFVFAWNSTVCNSADSGAVAVVMGVSNEYWKPSRGLDGTGNTDSLAVSNGTEHVKWFSTDASATLCATANSDSIVVHAENTANQASTELAGRMVSTSPAKYAYFRYTAGAANSASNKFRHVVVSSTAK